VWEHGLVNGADHLRVSFPADQGFDRIGRVAVAGLALRLGFDVATVERIRLAVDRAVGELAGPGRVELVARWSPRSLVLEVANPQVELDDERRRKVHDDLAELTPAVTVDASRLSLEIPAG
jgi:hypothetical protein